VLSRFARLRLLDLTHSDEKYKGALGALVRYASPLLKTLVLDCIFDGLTDDVVKHIAVGLPRLRALSFRWCMRIAEKAYRYIADKALRELSLGWEYPGNAERFRNLANGAVLMKSIEWLDLTNFTDDDSVRLLENIAIR
jgi:hypothetical protein